MQSHVNIKQRNPIKLLLAFSILVIINLISSTTIFILCDSDNHVLPTTSTTTTTSSLSSSTPPTTATSNTAKQQLQPADETDENHETDLSHTQSQTPKPLNLKDYSNVQFVSRGDVYFLISEPESLRYTFKSRSSRIGIPFTNTFSNIALVLAEPRDACTSTINKLEIRGNIALVERGGCSFLEKCIEIERSGGIALIVYDYDKHNDENYIEMIDDNTSRNCSIPAVSLLGKDGYMIVHSLLALKLNRAVITIPINVAKDEVSNPPWLMW